MPGVLLIYYLLTNVSPGIKDKLTLEITLEGDQAIIM